MEFLVAEKKKTRKPESDQNLNTKEEKWKQKGRRNAFHKNSSIFLEVNPYQTS